MFNPQEWTKVIVTQKGIKHIFYINEHTGLAKIKETFTHEQQKKLEEHEVDTWKS